MCGIFGMFSYGKPLNQSDVNSVITYLGHESCERGTDATGIAYVTQNKIEIKKEAKAAYNFRFRLPVKTRAVIGHTRFATQGSYKIFHNNHPFPGTCQKTAFALAHNGIIYNDQELRKVKNLPVTKIQTDSYIAVQLLEAEREISPVSIKNMAEQLQGSFCFSILDQSNILYIVKGGNPITIVHLKDLKAYVYASTERILWRGIISSGLFEDFKRAMTGDSKQIEWIWLDDGDILQFGHDGELCKTRFDFCEGLLTGRRNVYPLVKKWDVVLDDDYFDQLKQTASSLGVSLETVDGLLKEGYSLDEIEDIVYNSQYERN